MKANYIEPNIFTIEVDVTCQMPGSNPPPGGGDHTATGNGNEGQEGDGDFARVNAFDDIW